MTKPGARDAIDPKAVTETESPLRAVKVRAFCDCGQRGELRSIGQGVSTGWTSSWLNKCQKCGAQVMLNKSYPAVEYRSDTD